MELDLFNKQDIIEYDPFEEYEDEELSFYLIFVQV
jgi:hypothetical protein